ncbi:hypothetical protein [Streptomyces sp. Tu 2975]|nr:hypothetical protein [Streptomyces sp. Tu 2975]
MNRPRRPPAPHANGRRRTRWGEPTVRKALAELVAHGVPLRTD